MGEERVAYGRLRIRVLGPMEIRRPDSDTWAPVTAPKIRTLLATLLVHPGRALAVDELAEALWGSDVPKSTASQVHVTVSRARRVLGDDDGVLLRGRSPGYELVVDADEIDTRRFERLSDAGAAALRHGLSCEASRLLREALGLWQGAAFADVQASGPITAEAARLEELRLAALESRISADLAADLAAEDDDVLVGLVGELRRLVSEHPFRERFWAQLVRALHLRGSRARALRVYDEAAALLAEELGVEPGRDLQAAYREVRSLDPTLVPRQLPVDIARFTGRTAELSTLAAQLADSPVVTITGPGGMGKTALAVRLARRVASDFPDGQLYVDLHGYAPTAPLEPVEVLGRFLRAFGVADDRVPTRLGEAKAMYRALVSERRVLVLADNARDAAHVDPLLVADSACRLIVTSRHRLGDLRVPSAGLDLGPLPAADAIALLDGVLGHGRTSAEPAEARELAELCDRLPLALRITAANLAGNPELSLGAHVRRVREGPRLGTLVTEGASSSCSSSDSVRVALDWSYLPLPPEQARLFRLLGLVPGADFSVEAAVAMADRPAPVVSSMLDMLVDRNLLDRRGTGRYGFHDLPRLYARNLCTDTDPDDVRESALDGLRSWYLRRAVSAVVLVDPEHAFLPETRALADTDAFCTADEAMAWLEAERPMLVAVARESTGPTVWLLADAFRAYFFLRRHYADWTATASLGIAAADAAGDLAGMAAGRLSLAQAYRCLGRYDEGWDLGHRAIELFERVPWPRGKGTALNDLALLRYEQGRLAEATELFAHALDVARTSGSERDAALHLGNLGMMRRAAGDFRSARRYLEETEQLDRRTGTTYQLGYTLNELANVAIALGEYADAERYLDEAHECHARVDFLPGTSTVLDLRALLELHRDRPDEALPIIERSLQICREIQNDRELAGCLTMYSRVLSTLGRYDEALHTAREALRLADGGTRRQAYVDAQIRIGSAYLGLGSVADGSTVASKAAETAQELGFRLHEAAATALRARCLLALSRLDEAESAAEAALGVFEDIGHLRGQDRTRQVLAEIATARLDFSPRSN